jgi:glycosyltransferase involved in cell wall biosynthesis
MLIAIDITPMESAHKNRGIGIYTKNLVEAIKKVKSDNKYIFFTRSQKIPNNADLVHYPYFDPFFLTLPIITRLPTVVTIHDLIPIVFPKYFPRGIKGEIMWQIQKKLVSHSNRIITDSKNSKNDVVKYIGIDESKIDPIYLAPAEIFGNKQSREFIDSVKKRYTLPENYLVYVGDINWNKNISGILKAFAAFLDLNPQSNLKLLLVGKSFETVKLTETININQTIEKLRLNDKIIKVGYVDEMDECVLYSQAKACLLVSYYEGFGLPILEAMATGCPVIAADNSSISEIMGPSIKVNANKIDSIVSGIGKIYYLSNSERATLIREGKNWANNFTWEETARRTIETYEKVKCHNSSL